MKNVLSSVGKSGYLKTTISVSGSLTSTGSGNLLSYVSMNPSGSSEWTSLSTLFDEFRVVGAKLHLLPMFSGSTTAGMICVCYDNDSLTTPASIDDVMCYKNSKMAAFYKGIAINIKRPNITASAYWTDVASPSNSAGSFPYVIGFCSATTTVGYMSIKYDVGFRGRR